MKPKKKTADKTAEVSASLNRIACDVECTADKMFHSRHPHESARGELLLRVSGVLAAWASPRVRRGPPFVASKKL